jgi:hypothetical protein
MPKIPFENYRAPRMIDTTTSMGFPGATLVWRFSLAQEKGGTTSETGTVSFTRIHPASFGAKLEFQA